MSLDRRAPLRADPEATRAWQDRSRRKARFTNRTQLRRTRGLRQRSAKRAAQDRALDRARFEVVARSEGRCEANVEAVCTGRGEHAHHVRRRSQGGPDTADNLLWLCASCHRFVHDNPAAAAAMGLLKRTVTDG